MQVKVIVSDMPGAYPRLYELTVPEDTKLSEVMWSITRLIEDVEDREERKHEQDEQRQ